MKILSLVWFKVLPARFGGQKGTAEFNRHLAERAELVCLCSSDNEPEGPLPYRLLPLLPPGKSAVARPWVWRLIRRTVSAEQPTHLLLEYPYHALGAVRACRRYGAKLVLHEHNIEYRRFRALGHPGWRLLKAYERWACRQADLVLFKTEADLRHARDVFGLPEEKTFLVPYGIDPTTAKPSPVDIREQWSIPRDTLLYLFAGTLDYAPNAAAVRALYEEVAPRLDATGRPYRILVCGRNRSTRFRELDTLRHPNIIRCGEVPDIEPYFAAADLFLNPVLEGGGVQTKVIDALGAGVPVAAFTFAAQGILTATCGSALHTVPDGDWPALVRAAQDLALARPSVPPAFFETYSWPHITEKLVNRLNMIGNG